MLFIERNKTKEQGLHVFFCIIASSSLAVHIEKKDLAGFKPYRLVRVLSLLLAKNPPKQWITSHIMFCVISLKVSAKKKCLRDSEKIAGVGEKEEILYTN